MVWQHCEHAWHWSLSHFEHNPPTGSSTQHPFQAWHGSHWCDQPNPAVSRRAGDTRRQKRKERDYTDRIQFVLLNFWILNWSLCFITYTNVASYQDVKFLFISKILNECFTANHFICTSILLNPYLELPFFFVPGTI